MVQAFGCGRKMVVSTNFNPSGSPFDRRRWSPKSKRGGPGTPAAAGQRAGTFPERRGAPYQRMPIMMGISLVSALMLTGARPLADLLLRAGESTSR